MNNATNKKGDESDDKTKKKRKKEGTKAQNTQDPINAQATTAKKTSSPKKGKIAAKKMTDVNALLKAGSTLNLVDMDVVKTWIAKHKKPVVDV